MAIHFNIEDHVYRSPDLPRVVSEAVDHFVRTPIRRSFPEIRFGGVGVYALYYIGSFTPYALISQQATTESTIPIYVGKAVPPGWRTGRVTSQRTVGIYRRLAEHRRSLEEAINLDSQDVMYRFMILEGSAIDLISTVESALIRKFGPLWNSTIDGFGNHDPGSGRYYQSPSDWDVLHPGRGWVEKLEGTPTPLPNILNNIHDALNSIRFP